MADSTLAVPILLTSITEEHVIALKRRLLASRGLASAFPLASALLPSADGQLNFSQHLIDAVQVIHLTEIEHYFLVSADTPLSAVITPRTEMNTLIYLFKQLRLLGAQATAKDQSLLDSAFATLARLCDGFILRQKNEKYKLKSRLAVIGDPAAKAFEEWIKTTGIVFNLELADFDLTGRGLAPARPIARNEVLIQIPWKVIFSVFSALEAVGPFGDALRHLKEAESLDNDSLLILFAINEKFNNPSSFWRAYFDLLPSTVDSGLYFSAAELAQCLSNHPMAVEIGMMQTHLRATYDALVPPLTQSSFGALFPAAVFTWEHYLWARSMFDSRGFHLALNDVTYNCLLPVVDCLNNHTISMLEGSSVLQEPAKDYTVRCLVPLQSGQQVFMNYGAFSHRELLLFYGYRLPEDDITNEVNPYDVYPLGLDLPDEDGAGELRQQIMQRCDVTTDHYLKLDQLFPRRFLVVLRIFILDAATLQALIAEKDDTKVWRSLCKGIEKDGDVLNAALSVIDSLIDNVLSASQWANPDVEMGEMLSEREQLATHFVRKQVKILRNAKSQLERLLHTR